MPLKALRLIRRMRGGAQSHLLEADDSNFYVVKFQQNPQHRRILINELIGSVFLQYLQISSPPAKIVKTSKEFAKQNPDAHIQWGTKRSPIKPGWHFGSRYPDNPSHVAVYDFIPDVLLQEVSNLSDFIGVLVFDKWTGNADGRQSIFFRARLRDWMRREDVHPLRVGFVALMIDQGYLFNGPHWDFPDSPIQGIYNRHCVYDAVRSWDDLEPWLEQVKHFPEEVVDRACKQIPPEWIDGEEDEFESLLERLLRRRKRIPDLMSECRKAKTSPFSNWR